jgi:tripartite-type tricarboxylate transporter receptor subunit TctC
VTFIHYKGNALNFIDLVAGRVHVSPMTSFAAMSFVKAGKVRPIAHLSVSRSKVMPDLPAVSEQGVPGYDYSSWGAILTTGGSPPAAINKLSAAIRAYTRVPEASARAIREGYELVGSTPEALGELIDAEMVRWKKVVVDNNIKFGE